MYIMILEKNSKLLFSAQNEKHLSSQIEIGKAEDLSVRPFM